MIDTVWQLRKSEHKSTSRLLSVCCFCLFGVGDHIEIVVSYFKLKAAELFFSAMKCDLTDAYV